MFLDSPGSERHGPEHFSYPIKCNLHFERSQLSQVSVRTIKGSSIVYPDSEILVSAWILSFASLPFPLHLVSTPTTCDTSLVPAAYSMVVHGK